MSNRLREKYIQEVALEYLEKRYRKFSYNGQIKALKEAHTIGGKRADGIIVWKKSPKEVRLVSMEAKSASTISNLLKRWDQEKLSNWSLIASEGVILVGFCLLYHFAHLRVPLDISILLLLFLTLHLLLKPIRVLLQSQFAHLFQTASVFEQAALYPGNEVWIAIGKDTFKQKRIERLNYLKTHCKKKGFGLLEIGHQEVTTILLHPQFKPAYRVGDYLTYYKKETPIRQEISVATRKLGLPFYVSRAERRYYFNSFGTSCICVSLLLLLNFPITHKKFGSPPSQTELLYTYEESDPIPTSTTTYQEIATSLPSFTEEEQPSYATCYFPYEGYKYLIKDRIVATERAAQERLEELRQLNIPGSNYFFIPCSNMNQPTSQWIVYAYPPRSDYQKALNNLERYEWILQQKQQSSFGVEILWVRKAEDGLSFK